MPRLPTREHPRRGAEERRGGVPSSPPGVRSMGIAAAGPRQGHLAMTRSAPRYIPPADRARRAARDPFAVRHAVLFAAGVIIKPIAALIARINGHEVVR